MCTRFDSAVNSHASTLKLVTTLAQSLYSLEVVPSVFIFNTQAKYRPVDLLEKEPLKVHLYTLLRCSAITVFETHFKANLASRQVSHENIYSMILEALKHILKPTWQADKFHMKIFVHLGKSLVGSVTDESVSNEIELARWTIVR